MPNVKKKVPWEFNNTARSLPLLKNDRPISLKTPTHGTLEVETQPKSIERSYAGCTRVEVDINQNYRFQLKYDSENILPSMNTTIHRQRNNVNDQQNTGIGCAMLCERTDGDCGMVSSSTIKNMSEDSNYYTTMDHCDESSRGNSCSQLLHNSFPATSVPNAVASFSSLTSASLQENPMRRGRLKVASPSYRVNNGRTRRRNSPLLSFMIRQFLVYRRNCHSVVGNAVLIFMLFLAMLHLSW